MKTNTLLKKLSKKFPKRIAKSHNDFVGLMCGTLKKETKTIVLCLDMDNTILCEVLAFKPDLIITHHPFIYGKKSKVLKEDALKLELFNELIKNNIPVYSYHTNFDEGKDGMNDALANELELQNIHQHEQYPMMRVGELKNSMKMNDLSEYLMKKLKVDHCLVLDHGKTDIKTVGIVGGGGWFLYKLANNTGIDCYVSGDIPHHGRRGVVLNKCNYIDLPHEVENIFMKQMKKVLLEIDNTLEIIEIYHEKNSKINYLK